MKVHVDGLNNDDLNRAGEVEGDWTRNGKLTWNLDDSRKQEAPRRVTVSEELSFEYDTSQTMVALLIGDRFGLQRKILQITTSRFHTRLVIMGMILTTTFNTMILNIPEFEHSSIGLIGSSLTFMSQFMLATLGFFMSHPVVGKQLFFRVEGWVIFINATIFSMCIHAMLSTTFPRASVNVAVQSMAFSIAMMDTLPKTEAMKPVVMVLALISVFSLSEYVLILRFETISYEDRPIEVFPFSSTTKNLAVSSALQLFPFALNSLWVACTSSDRFAYIKARVRVKTIE